MVIAPAPGPTHVEASPLTALLLEVVDFLVTVVGILDNAQWTNETLPDVEWRCGEDEPAPRM